MLITENQWLIIIIEKSSFFLELSVLVIPSWLFLWAQTRVLQTIFEMFGLQKKQYFYCKID